MVSSEDSDSVLEADLEGDEQGHGLHRVVPSVDVVTHEEVVRVGELSANHEKLTQVVELTVDIAADGHGSHHVLHVRLVDQDLFRLKEKEHWSVNSRVKREHHRQPDRPP